MQSELIKKRIIGNLVDEIVELDASTLEHVGHSLIELLEEKRLIHHGLNIDYRPVGYTVDTFSQGFVVTGEYSAEKKYFEAKKRKPADKKESEVHAKGDSSSVGLVDSVELAESDPSFPKIEKDVQHVVDHSGGKIPDKIYLICSQKEPESFRAKFNRTPISKEHGERINILGAGEIAKLIYEFSTENQTAATYFASIFPGFSQDLDNFAYYGKAPNLCEHHVSDAAVLKEIRDHFGKGHRVCFLTGISGSGKTQAAIDFLRSDGSTYENYIWISGDDWKVDTSLSSVQRLRGGVAINVAGIFNSYKTLLIVDSLDRDPDEGVFIDLEKGFELGGRILVTSQLSPQNASVVHMPTISHEAAAAILNVRNDSISETALEFLEACRFSPLILATTRKLIEAEGVPAEELYAEILSDPQAIADSNGVVIMGRILSRLDQKYLLGLRQIANSGSFTNDATFLGSFLGYLVTSHLKKLSILRPAVAPELLVVHDLICHAVRDCEDYYPLVAAITKFVAKHSGEMVPSVIRQIHLCAAQLMIVYKNRQEKSADWLSYALLQLDAGRGLVEVDALSSRKIGASTPLQELLCVIDAREALAYSVDQTKRQELFRGWAEEYGTAQDGDPESEVNLELLHHQGKSLRRCGNLRDALRCFQNLLTMRPDWHATHLQIAHLGTQYDADSEIKSAGEVAIQTLVARVIETPHTVPLRVSLASVARLRSYKSVAEKLAVNPTSVGVLADVIALSALDGLDQFYEAYLSFTSLFAYRYPDACVTLAEGLPEILTMPPERVDQKQWTSACESLGNTSSAAGSAGKGDLQRRVRDAGVAFAVALSKKDHIKSYDARAVAKMFLLAGAPADALAVIKKVPPEAANKDHWLLYRKTEAELALGNPKDALHDAEQALTLAQSDKYAQNHLASYYELLSKVHEALGSKELAIDCLEAGINVCSSGKYKEALSARLSSLK